MARGGAVEEAREKNSATSTTAYNGKDKDGTVERVRKFFPETWLFDVVLVGKDGELVMSKTAPDTVTTWLTTAFAVHPKHGLSVLPQAAELTTFRKMFVSVDLPYSAVRGEDLCLRASAFNYHDKALPMRIMMQRSPGLSNIRVSRLRVRKGNKYLMVPRLMKKSTRISHYLGMVPPNEMGETSFCFTPDSLGLQTIRINLTSPRMPGDGIERKLLVEAGGMPRAHTQSVIVDLSQKKEFREVVPIQFPTNTISGSHRITVSIASDLLGPVFNNIQDLLRMPYGCGEQNMLYFAPNVYLVKYFKKTDSYTPKLAEKAENFMMVGYQKELKYKHKDGSYSAFGERPNRTESGSMWLTAFVTKCFAQSMFLGEDVISVERNIVHKALAWMISKQHKNGAFPEPGKVFNKNMQGGSAKGEALTAYVLIALAEAKLAAHHTKNETDVEMKMLKRAMKKSQRRLEERLKQLTDPYDVAIVTYALHLTNSSKSAEAFEILKDVAIRESFTMHWERAASAKKPQYYHWQRRTDAINIEMTAYALLTYLQKNDITGAAPIIRWLTQQRGPQGGFISTQDTVIALQGLSEVATVLYQPRSAPIKVSVHWSSDKQPENERMVTLTDDNKLLLHQIDVPAEDNPDSLTIVAENVDSDRLGGMAVAEVILDYNVNQTMAKEVAAGSRFFNISAQVLPGNPVLLQLQACRADGMRGSMTVIEVGVPTGYTVDEAHPSYNVAGTKMAQSEPQRKKKYALYYVTMNSTSVHASLPMVASDGMSITTQESSIIIYDYYENSQEATTSYNVDFQKENVFTNLCRKQPYYESCRFINN